MKKKIDFILIVILGLSGCVSLRDPDQRFIDAMNQEISMKQNIKELDFNQNYPNGYYIADRRYLTIQESRSDGFLIYHYARGML